MCVCVCVCVGIYIYMCVYISVCVYVHAVGLLQFRLSLCERGLKALDLIAETVGSRSPRPWVILIDVVRLINIVDGGAI